MTLDKSVRIHIPKKIHFPKGSRYNLIFSVDGNNLKDYEISTLKKIATEIKKDIIQVPVMYDVAKDEFIWRLPDSKKEINSELYSGETYRREINKGIEGVVGSIDYQVYSIEIPIKERLKQKDEYSELSRRDSVKFNLENRTWIDVHASRDADTLTQYLGDKIIKPELVKYARRCEKIVRVEFLEQLSRAITNQILHVEKRR